MFSNIGTNTQYFQDFKNNFISTIPEQIRRDVEIRESYPEHQGKGQSCTDVIRIVRNAFRVHYYASQADLKIEIEKALIEYSTKPEMPLVGLL